MERFIADLVRNFESGRINRRQFCEAVTLAATVYAAGDTAKAQPSRGLKMLGINHVSYSCADYAKVRDFYVNHLGMQSVPDKDNGSRANLMFGPEPGKGGQFLVASYELALVTAANLHIGTRFRLRLVLRYRDWGHACQW